jgi:hypothetical protein
LKSLLNKTLATLLLVTILGTLLTSCTKNLPKETIVYQNSFDNGKGDMQVFKPNGLDANSFGLNFEGRNILGPFNHRTAYINLPQLPPHVLLNLSFDLYIHDQWAGYGINPPDYWGLYIDKQRVFYTTFSNTANAAQAYPEHEGYLFPPASNAIEKLPGLNSLSTRSDGTAMYHFVWSVAHTNSSIEIALSDLVADTNVLNKSWSIDNLKVVTTQIIK